MNCPLCGGINNALYHQDKTRSYYQCSNCSLVFVPRSELINPTAEKERYDSHNNDDHNEAYQSYLSSIADLIIPHLKSESRGLDFGSGRSKLLERILETKGHPTSSYDLYFHPSEEVLSKRYDFISMIEVIEHLREPFLEMIKLKNLLRSEGKLFIKTRLLPDSKNLFENWYYKRDITHVQFFSEESLVFLVSSLGMKEKRILSPDLFVIE